MNDSQENKLSMFIKVDTFLTNNAAALAAVTQIAGIKTALETLIDNITTTGGLIIDDTTGYTIEKSIKRAELEAIMLKVAHAATGYYASIENPTGFKTADYTRSELHASRDSELYTRAKRLHTFVTPIAALLTGFNSGPADVADLDAKKEAFFDVIQNPQTKRGEKSAAVIDLENYFTDADSLLFTLDAYMNTFEAVNLNLFNQYQSARSIDDLGGGSGSGETIISTVQNSIAAGATVNVGALPSGTQKVKMAVTSNGPLEFGLSVDGNTFNGNTTSSSSSTPVVYNVSDFASAGSLMLVRNQSATLAGAYRIDFLA